MKLFRFGQVGLEKPGVLMPNNRKIDVSGFIGDYNEFFFQTNGIQRLQEWLTSNADSCPTVGDHGTHWFLYIKAVQNCMCRLKLC